MEKMARVDRIDMLELEVDRRLNSIRDEFLELTIITPDTAKSLITRSFRKAIEDIITGQYPDIASQMGYPQPTTEHLDLPKWDDPNHVLSDEEIIEYLEKSWGYSIEECVSENMDVLGTFMRAAYGDGYVYARVTHQTGH